MDEGPQRVKQPKPLDARPCSRRPTDVLAGALKPLVGKLRLVFVYGSIASGQERSDSDIDLMVIGAVLPASLLMVRKFGPNE